MRQALAADFDDTDDPLEDLGYKSKTIKSSLYEQRDPKAVADKQTHLSPSQRQDLAEILSRFPKLFSGKLGCYQHHKVLLDIKADAKPPTVSGPKTTPESLQRRTRTIGTNRRVVTLWSIRMAISLLHYTKEGWSSTLDIRFSGLE